MVLANALRRKRQFVHLVQIDFVELLVEYGNILHILAGQNHVHIGDLVDLLDDILIVRCSDLCTIRPISLVTVVLLRIVRSRDNHTRMALELADGETQLGRRTQRVEQKDGKTVRCKDISHMLGKQTRIVAAVVTDGNANLFTGEILFQIVSQSLRSSAYRIDIHTVAAHTHDAAQASRTEFEILIEALDELFHIVIDQILDLLFRSVVIMTVQPRLGLFQDRLFQFVYHKISIIFIG